MRVRETVNFLVVLVLGRIIWVLQSLGVCNIWRQLLARNKTVISSQLPSHIHIGFALSPAYGTLAIYNAKTNVQWVTKVPGSDDYVKTMRRLSEPSAMHPSRPYHGYSEYLNDVPRQWLRQARKSCGLPASTDVGNVASLLGDMKARSEQHLGFKVDGADIVVAMPSIVALYDEDVVDALQYLALKAGTSRLSYEQPRAMSTACIGYGVADEERGLQIPSQMALNIEIASDSLSIESDKAGMALSLRSHTPRSTKVDFTLGASRRNDNAYWMRVERLIKDVVSVYNNPEKPELGYVFLIGESADHRDWQEEVKNILNSYGDVTVYSDDPHYVAAKGSARLAYLHGKRENQFDLAPE